MEIPTYRGVSFASVVTLVVAGVIAAFVLPSHAFASNGSCIVSEGTEFCNYGNTNIPKETRDYFEAPGGNNQRNWYENIASDPYGGSVGKCAGVQHANGEISRTCGTGNQYQASNAAWNPSFIFIFHYAEGPRTLSGEGLILGKAPAVTGPPLTSPGQGIERFEVLSPAQSAAFGSGAAAEKQMLNAASAAAGGSSDRVAAISAYGTASTGPAGTVEVAETESGICLTADGALTGGAIGGSCHSLLEAESGEAYSFVPDAATGKVVLVGIVPNDVTQVRVESADGSTEMIPVVDNTYAAQLNPATASVSGIDADGGTTFNVEIPLGMGGK